MDSLYRLKLLLIFINEVMSQNYHVNNSTVNALLSWIEQDITKG